jgi:hypothetical protein
MSQGSIDVLLQLSRQIRLVSNERKLCDLDRLVGRNVIGGQKRYPDWGVRVGNQIWDGVSVDRFNLTIGDEVTIRSVEGLKLIIEKTRLKNSRQKGGKRITDLFNFLLRINHQWGQA